MSLSATEEVKYICNVNSDAKAKVRWGVADGSLDDRVSNILHISQISRPLSAAKWRADGEKGRPVRFFMVFCHSLSLLPAFC